MVSASRMNADHLSGRGGHTTTAPISPVSTNGQIASNSPLATPDDSESRSRRRAQADQIESLPDADHRVGRRRRALASGAT
jgi:hypothetical protein